MNPSQLSGTRTPRAGRQMLGYFIVRVRRLPGTPIGEVTGVVERLGTGEKRMFQSSAELAQVVAEWSE